LNKTSELYLNIMENIVVELNIIYIIYGAQCTINYI
jgi:hypothetical protein